MAFLHHASGETLGSSDRQARAPRADLPALTGLRGAAAVYVVVFHLLLGIERLQGAGAVVAHGYVAVDLFFVLSGFVISYTSAAAFAEGPTPAACLDFLCKRLLRVYPLYIAVVAFLALWRHAEASTVLWNALMVQSWGLGGSVASQSWSISTEFAAYLLFPLLVRLILGRQASWACAAAALAVLALGLVATRSGAELGQFDGGLPYKGGPLDATSGHTLYPVLRCLAGFSFGMVAFRVRRWCLGSRTGVPAFSADAVAVTALGLLALPGSDVALVPLFAALVFALTSSASLVGRVLASAPLLWLGETSYSIYLTHIAVFEALGRPLDRLLAPSGLLGLREPLLIAAVLAVSTATFHAIEKPARRFGRRKLGRRITPITLEAAAP